MYGWGMGYGKGQTGYGANVPGYRAPQSRSLMSQKPPTYSGSRGYGYSNAQGFGGGGMPGSRGFPSYGPAAAPAGPSTITAPGITGGGAVNSNLDFPEATPYGGNAYNDPNLAYMAKYAKGLMDPDSDLYKRMSAGMQKQIGAQTAAQQRGARLRQAWGGGGAGNTGELMATTADLGQAGLEAQGQAEANLRLAAPQMGMQGLQSTFNPQLGYNQLTEGSQQFGAGLAEGARQWGGNMAFNQQQLAAQNALAQANMGMQANMFNAQQQNQWAMEQQRREWEAMMQQMAMAYS